MVTWVGDQRGARHADRVHPGGRPQRGDRERASSRDRLVSVAGVRERRGARDPLDRAVLLPAVRGGRAARASGASCAGQGLRRRDLLVVLGAAIYLAYIFKLAGNLPKYHAAMLPSWAAAAGALVARLAGRPTLAQYGVALLVGAVVAVWWLPDRMAGFLGISLGGPSTPN